jgi:hypothetical protein
MIKKQIHTYLQIPSLNIDTDEAKTFHEATVSRILSESSKGFNLLRLETPPPPLAYKENGQKKITDKNNKPSFDNYFPTQ